MATRPRVCHCGVICWCCAYTCTVCGPRNRAMDAAEQAPEPTPEETP